MKKDSSGGLAPVPGYFTSQMLQMKDLVTADEMPFFDIVEYGRGNRLQVPGGVVGHKIKIHSSKAQAPPSIIVHESPKVRHDSAVCTPAPGSVAEGTFFCPHVPM